MHLSGCSRVLRTIRPLLMATWIRPGVLDGDQVVDNATEILSEHLKMVPWVMAS